MDESDKAGAVTEIVKAVGEIVEKVPIYQDAIQPAAKELGKGFEVLAKAINAALSPVEGLIWGVDQIRDFVRDRVAKKLEGISVENIQQPKPHVAVPAIDALRYTGADSDLSELYANLLVTSMDKTTAYRAHPAFVDMIKNMCPDEARIMRFFVDQDAAAVINIKLISSNGSFSIMHRHVSLIGVDAGCEHISLTPNYLDNLIRLGLLDLRAMRLMDDELYIRIEANNDIKQMITNLKKIDGKKVEIEKKGVTVTDLGIQFINSCVVERRVEVV